MRHFGLLQSILLVGNHAQKAMLLDTSVQTSDLVKEGADGWHISPGSQWMESTGFNQYGDSLRVWSICKKPSALGNMIVSPFINSGRAMSVEAELQYWIRECHTLGRYRQCSEEIEVYVQQVDSFTQRDDNADSTAWQKIGTISATDASSEGNSPPTKKFTIQSDKSGLFIGFKDYGSCTSINSVRVYTSSCNEKVEFLASYEETSTNREVIGKCVENAVTDSYFKEPKMKCTENGWQAIDYKGCVCDAGYEPDVENRSCIACRPGTYKKTSGNEQCIPCPSNSNSQAAALTCDCNPATYRANDQPAEECIDIPGAPSDVNYDTSKNSAQLYWKRPLNYPRRDIYYRLECSKCVDAECYPCDQQVVYSTGPDAISEGHKGSNQLTIGNLEANTLYDLKLFTLNRISDLAEEDGKSPKFTRISFTTEIDKEQVIPEIVGSVKVDLKGDTARVTWGAVEKDQYEIMVNIDGETQKPIMTANDEHTLENLTPGQTYKINVRAWLDDVRGPWSIDEFFKTPFTVVNSANPTVEQITDNGLNTTNWVALIAFAVVTIIALFAVLIFFVIRNIGRKWSKQSNGTYGQSMDGTMDAHFDLIPQIVRKSPTQIDGLSISSDHESLPAHADMTRGYYHERPVLLQYGYLTEEQFSMVTQLDHQNVLKCLGFAPSRQQLVFEYAEHGTLPALMGYHRLDIVTVTRILRDIASAVNFLHSHAYIHRQLTTYNVFVSGAGYTPKVAKYLTSNDLRPDLRRSAPEIWENKPFTMFSDVWSFGTIMWEVVAAFSGADSEPYRGFEETEILEQMRQARHLPRPDGCPEAIYSLITACWSIRPQNRPRMAQICQELDNILNQMDPNGCVAV